MRNILLIFKGDRVIWVLMVFLTIYSGLAVSSSVAALVYRDGGNATMHIVRHLGFLAIGWAIIYIIHKVSYKHYSSLANLILVLAIILLVLTLAFGVSLNGANRGMSIYGIAFQSFDFAKIALIIFVARFLSRNQTEIEDFKKGFLPVLLIISLICALILRENFSTAFILFTTCLVLLYIGRVKVQYLIGLAVTGLVLLAIVVLIGKYTDIFPRVKTWEHRLEERFSKDSNSETRFQAIKAEIAIANGGMIGKFAGHSTQRRSLPQAYSDFIFAIVIEEYGLLFGALPLLFIYLILLYRAGVIVRKCDRTFPAFLVIGLMVGLVIQAMVNMGVSSGLLPVTGQTLPWVSRGGTSILFTALAMGIILGVSRSIEEEASVEQG